MDVFSFFFVSEAIESENSHGNHHISKRRIIFLKVFCVCFFVYFLLVLCMCACVCVCVLDSLATIRVKQLSD